MPCSRTRLSRNPSTTCSRRLFDQAVLWIVQAIEAAGIAIIVLGGVVATALFLRRLSRTDGFSDSYHRYRENLGRAILLGLEFLVAADIMRRVRRHPGPRDDACLGPRGVHRHADVARVGRGLRAQSLMTRPTALLALVAVLGTFLIFGGLDRRYLWDDEAETALLAQRVLRFGVPVAWDGASLISHECGADYDDNYLWQQTPWLPIYLAAASLALLDV